MSKSAPKGSAFCRNARGADGAATLAGVEDKPLRCIGEVSECNRHRPVPDARCGVEDAAPYGWVRNVGISIAINRCVNAANLILPLSAPLKGELSRRKAP